MQTIYLYIFVFMFGGFFSLNDQYKEPALAHEYPKKEYIAFLPGEKLKYDINYNGISAGEGNFEIKTEPKIIAGKPHFHISITGKSYPVLDPFYKIRDYYESFIDQETLMPSVFIRNVTEGKYTDQEYYIFDRSRNSIIANKHIYAVKSNMHDIVSAFYYLRCVDFSNKQPGYVVDVNSFFDEEELPMGVQYIGKKTITSSHIGTVKCLVFRPKLIEGRVFEDQEDMTLYVSDDKNQ
ncbi:MAG: DUF3108 domain-containing protein, partial [Bacteroidia bacterium]